MGFGPGPLGFGAGPLGFGAGPLGFGAGPLALASGDFSSCCLALARALRTRALRLGFLTLSGGRSPRRSLTGRVWRLISQSVLAAMRTGEVSMASSRGEGGGAWREISTSLPSDASRRRAGSSDRVRGRDLLPKEKDTGTGQVTFVGKMSTIAHSCPSDGNPRQPIDPHAQCVGREASREIQAPTRLGGFPQCAQCSH